MVTASFALGASLVLHWDLGMSRDWDILAVFSLPLIPAALAGLRGAVRDERLRAQVLVVVGASMLLHTIPWIGVNADTERSINRIHMLPERSVWGTTAWKAFLEELAIHFRDNHRPADAVTCYEQYLAIDSMNPRIWANYAYVCSETGDDDKALAANERAARYGSTWYGVYANLGSLYARRDRIDEAIAMLKKSLALNAAQPVIFDALGNLLMSHRRSYERRWATSPLHWRSTRRRCRQISMRGSVPPSCAIQHVRGDTTRHSWR
jgi:tetratricopeptide (TPR) repeat protein